MSLAINQPELRQQATLFNALGDNIRLQLVAQLADGTQRSITELAANFSISRQAITKHLKLLADAGVVTCVQTGRKQLFQLRGESLSETKQIIESIEAQWGHALNRLKTFVEQD